MKTHSRRSFLRMAVKTLIGLLIAKFSLIKQGIRKDHSLKEADFYEKHNLSG